MRDQWGNEITTAQTETEWVFTRGGDSASYSLSMSREDATACALASFNGMQPEGAQ